MIAVAVAKRLDLVFTDLTYAAIGTTGGNVFVDWMPNTPDIAVAVMTLAGRPQLSKLPHDLPGIQIIVRGEPSKSLAAFAMAAAVYGELQCLDLTTLDSGGAHEVFVIGCTADQSGPVSIGRDELQRPEYSLNFSLVTSSPTTHRPAVTA